MSKLHSGHAGKDSQYFKAFIIWFLLSVFSRFMDVNNFCLGPGLIVYIIIKGAVRLSVRKHCVGLFQPRGAVCVIEPWPPFCTEQVGPICSRLNISRVQSDLQCWGGWSRRQRGGDGEGGVWARRTRERKKGKWRESQQHVNFSSDGRPGSTASIC